MQKGQVVLWIVVGILVIGMVAGGAYYLGRSNTPKLKACTMDAKVCPDGSSVGRVGPNCEFAPCPSASPSPSPDETAKWKTYTLPDLTFKYPNNWYSENNPNYPGGNNVSFFLNGTKADHGYGDHRGNEVFSFEFRDDSRSLEALKKDYYSNAENLMISGKLAIQTQFNLIIIKVSDNKTLSIVGGLDPENANKILQTLKFSK